MDAERKTRLLWYRLERGGINCSFEQAETLRRAEMTLHRWGEGECGNDRGCIEMDETTGRYFWRYSDGRRGHDMADRKSGALRRVAQVCAELGLHFYHQGDPRGAALYVSREPLTDVDYNRGVCCCER